MDTSDMIPLGREYDDMPCSPGGMGKSKDGKKKMSYPTLYVRGMEDMPDLPKGDFYILAKVCVSRLSIDAKDSEGSSVEFDVKEMKPVGEAEDSEEGYEDDEEVSSAKSLAKAMGGEEGYED